MPKPSKLPDFEIIEEDSGGYNRQGKKGKIQIPHIPRTTCRSCDQVIEKQDGRLVPHNRKVFRNYKDGKPDWKIEICPGAGSREVGVKENVDS